MMKIFLYALGGLTVLSALAIARGAWRFAVLQSGLVATIEAAPTPSWEARDLPEPVRRIAKRAGADGGPWRFATLRQDAGLILEPVPDWQPAKARQWIGLSEPGFVWRADQPLFGPLRKASVIDAFTRGRGLLAVRLLGAVPVANATGDDIDLSEAMRYLAELPWAPDAILLNRDLIWQVVTEDRIAVSLGPAKATLVLNADGDIIGIEANDRPARLPDGTLELRDWKGAFSDYTQIGPRRIPRHGAVGYVGVNGFEPYFRGRITDYALHE